MRQHRDGLAERLRRAGVSEREADVLSAVAERLRNREIAERLHLSVRTVESHVAALMRKLGISDRTMLAELGVELRHAGRTDAALPSPMTSLVGRENELVDLTALVGAHRLVTLIGPGGVGKTRLALRVATVHSDRFPDGARLVDLAPVGPELVGDTLARALGVLPQPGWSLRDIVREVAATTRCLLLLDNCEHVIAQAAEMVADLLTAEGQLRVLATSREPLGVPGEVTYQVPPLSVPDARDCARAATASNYDAIRLFVDRAAAVSPGFTLTDAIAPAVAALCQRLDGLPLAIELAASRIRTFGPPELVEHLDRRFELLSGGARTAPSRHRTLRGAIDWSYDLLEDDERALFDRLAVFPADFDFAAARAVGADEDLGRETVIAVLPRLVDKSLVSTVGRDGYRYRLLETVRAYAVQRLAASGVEATARQQHASHYLALAEHAAVQLRTQHQRTWLERMTTEQPNLRAALAHSIASHDMPSAWRWVAALQRFWDITGQRREAEQWIQRTLAMGEPPATSVAIAGLAAASAIRQPSDSQAAFDQATQAAQRAADLDDFTRARAARAVGMSAMWVKSELVLPTLHQALALFGEDHAWESALTMHYLAQASPDLSESLRWGRASVALFRQVGDQMYAANTLFIVAQRSIYAGVGDDEVHEWLRESQALAEAAGSEEDRVHANVGFGQLAWLRGDHGHAAQLMQECLPTLRRLGDQRCTGRALYMLGERAQEQQQLDRAEELLGASVEAIVLAGQSVILVNALEALAKVHLARNQSGAAAVLLGTAHAVRESASVHMRPSTSPDQALQRTLRQALGPAAFGTAYAEGEAMSPTEALRYVTRLQRGDHREDGSYPDSRR